MSTRDDAAAVPLGRPRADDTRTLRPKVAYDGDGFARVLSALGVEMRLNVRTGEHEMSRDGGETWHYLDRYAEAMLRQDAAAAFRKDGRGDRHDRDWKPTGADWLLMLDAHLGRNEHDPVAAWLDGLPVPSTKPADDPADLLAGLFAHSAEIGDDHRAALRWASRSMFAGVIRRTRSPGAKQDEIAVLRGAPNLGKSTLPIVLLPEPSWIMEGLRLDYRNAESMGDAAAQLRAAVLAVADEMAGLRFDRIDAAKAILSQTSDTYREKYGRTARVWPRRCTIVGNCNPGKRFPFDPGLERRLVVVDLPDRPREPLEATFTPQRRADLWAAAVWHFDNEPEWASGEVPSAARIYSSRLYRDNLTKEGRDALAAHLAEGGVPM